MAQFKYTYTERRREGEREGERKGKKTREEKGRIVKLLISSGKKESERKNTKEENCKPHSFSKNKTKNIKLRNKSSKTRRP